jgi:hypothetical protein
VLRKIQPYENILELRMAKDDDDPQEPSNAMAGLGVIQSKRQSIPKEIIFFDHDVDWWKSDELPVCVRDFLYA